MMQSAYYDAYPPPYPHNSNNAVRVPPKKKKAAQEEDTQAVASFLLSLKHSRSVTPDPSLDDSDHHRRAPYQSYAPYAAYGYESPYPSAEQYYHHQQQQHQQQYHQQQYHHPHQHQQHHPHQHHQHPKQSQPQQPKGPPARSIESATPPPPTEITTKTTTTTTATSKKTSTTAATTATTTTTSPIDAADLPPYETLVDKSKLVLMKDRDLVPDALFIAMAQMKPCRLTHADRVGCYKSRELGFLGMCCKHCGGQPGFGRYYPNSVRSLAQTTTSQTILKHIGNKCRFCPPDVRKAVLQLQAQATACEGMSNGRPRYGSRKIFFQRVWARLHDEKEKPEAADDMSTQTPTDVDEPASCDEEMGAHAADADADDSNASPKRKNRFGGLPLQKNKRIKTTVALV